MEQRLWGLPAGLRAVFCDRKGNIAEDHLTGLWSDSWKPTFLTRPSPSADSNARPGLGNKELDPKQTELIPV